jgi:hypothetical protein
MKRILHTLALSALLLGTASVAHAAQVSVGIRIGTPPPPPRVYRASRQPGPNYVWVEGYWFPRGGRYYWRDGYWARPPYAGAYWVAPYYSHGRYFEGRWESRRDARRDDRIDRRNDRRDERFDRRR